MRLRTLIIAAAVVLAIVAGTLVAGFDDDSCEQLGETEAC